MDNTGAASLKWNRLELVNVGRTRRLISPIKMKWTHLHQNVLWPSKR